MLIARHLQHSAARSSEKGFNTGINGSNSADIENQTVTMAEIVIISLYYAFQGLFKKFKLFLMTQVFHTTIDRTLKP